MNYLDTAKEAGIKLAIDTVEGMVLIVTPDNVIDKVDELVRLIDDEDMTGEQKFMWVFNELKQLLSRIWRGLLFILTQMAVDAMKAGATGLRNEN